MIQRQRRELGEAENTQRKTSVLKISVGVLAEFKNHHVHAGNNRTGSSGGKKRSIRCLGKKTTTTTKKQALPETHERMQRFQRFFWSQKSVQEKKTFWRTHTRQRKVADER